MSGGISVHASTKHLAPGVTAYRAAGRSGTKARKRVQKSGAAAPNLGSRKAQPSAGRYNRGPDLVGGGRAFAADPGFYQK